ncbi:MAG: hypothetical protein NVSMB65_01720 [Chloroflexota bacterium]
MDSAQVTRGRLLRILGTAGSALVGLSIAATPRRVVALATRRGMLRKVTTVRKLSLGVNGPFPFTVDTTAALNTNQIFLVKAASGKVTALEATCRHKGCAVGWQAGGHKFHCPCHGSEYAISGAVTHGPAQANLFQHAVTVKAGQVWVMTTRGSL